MKSIARYILICGAAICISAGIVVCILNTYCHNNITIKFNANNATKIHLGMDIKQVINLLGTPDDNNEVSESPSSGWIILSSPPHASYTWTIHKDLCISIITDLKNGIEYVSGIKTYEYHDDNWKIKTSVR